MSHIRTDIELRLAGLALQQQQLRREPFKIVVAAMAAGAALMGGSVALVAALWRHA